MPAAAAHDLDDSTAERELLKSRFAGHAAKLRTKREHVKRAKLPVQTRACEVGETNQAPLLGDARNRQDCENDGEDRYNGGASRHLLVTHSGKSTRNLKAGHYGPSAGAFASVNRGKMQIGPCCVAGSQRSGESSLPLRRSMRVCSSPSPDAAKRHPASKFARGVPARLGLLTDRANLRVQKYLTLKL